MARRVLMYRSLIAQLAAKRRERAMSTTQLPSTSLLGSPLGLLFAV